METDGTNAAVLRWWDDETDGAERSGQDRGVQGVHVSQVHGVHTYSGLKDGVVERRFLWHAVVGKWGGAGEVRGLSLDSVTDTLASFNAGDKGGGHCTIRTQQNYWLGEVKENAQDDQQHHCSRKHDCDGSVCALGTKISAENWGKKTRKRTSVYFLFFFQWFVTAVSYRFAEMNMHRHPVLMVSQNILG